MFVDNEQLDRTYGGYNPDFVRRVQARRRAADRADMLAADRARRDQQLAVRKAELERVRLDYAAAVSEAREGRIARAHELAEQSNLSAKQLVAYIAAKHGFTFNELVGPSRVIPLVKARQEAMAEVRLKKPSMSLPQIGRLFNRDHTTVLHALRKRGVR